MTQETSTRIGLPVVLAFAIVFGLILTRHSSRYEVAPPPASDDVQSARPHSFAPISKAGLRPPGYEDPESFRARPRARPPVDRSTLPEPRSRAEDQANRVAGDRAVPSERARGFRDQRQIPADDAERSLRSAEHASPKRTTVDPPAAERAARRPTEVRPASDPPDEARTAPRIPSPEEPPAEKPPAPRKRPAKPAVPPTRKEPAETHLAHGEASGQKEEAGSGAKIVPAVYVIQRNDNLSKICKRIYGQADYRIVQAVYEANRDRLKNKNIVIPGQRLRIPPWPATRVERTQPAGSAKERTEDKGRAKGLIKLPEQKGGPERKSEASKRSAGREKKSGGSQRRYRWYRVRRNDSLSKIAQKKLGNGRRWYEIYKMNKSKLRKPNRLPVGTMIKVPLAAVADRSLLGDAL